MKVKKSMTFADLIKEIEKKQKKYNDIISDPKTTDLNRNTAKLNLQRVDEFAQQVYEQQEAAKQQLGIGEDTQPMPQAAYGYDGLEDPEYIKPKKLVDRSLSPSYNEDWGQRYYPIEEDVWGALPVKQNLQSPYSRTVTPTGYDPYWENPNSKALVLSEGDKNIEIDRSQGLPEGTTQAVIDRKNTIDNFIATDVRPYLAPEPVKEEKNALTVLKNSYENTTGNKIKKKDFVGYIIPALNVVRGAFDKAQQLKEEEYMTTGRVTPFKMDIDPQLRHLDTLDAKNRRNIRNMSPSQVISGNISSSDWVKQAASELWSQKYNVDRQADQAAQIANLEREARNKAMKLQINDWNARSKAAKQEMIDTGLQQGLETYWRNRSENILRDQLEAQKEFNQKDLELRTKYGDDYLKKMTETEKMNYDLRLKELEALRARVELPEVAEGEYGAKGPEEQNYTVFGGRGGGGSYRGSYKVGTSWIDQLYGSLFGIGTNPQDNTVLPPPNIGAPTNTNKKIGYTKSIDELAEIASMTAKERERNPNYFPPIWNSLSEFDQKAIEKMYPHMDTPRKDMRRYAFWTTVGGSLFGYGLKKGKPWKYMFPKGLTEEEKLAGKKAYEAAQDAKAKGAPVEEQVKPTTKPYGPKSKVQEINDQLGGQSVYERARASENGPAPSGTKFNEGEYSTNPVSGAKRVQLGVRNKPIGLVDQYGTPFTKGIGLSIAPLQILASLGSEKKIRKYLKDNKWSDEQIEQLVEDRYKMSDSMFNSIYSEFPNPPGKG